MAKTHIGWLEVDNYASDPTDTDPTRGGFAIVSDSPKYWDGTSWTTLEAGETTAHNLLSATHSDTTAGTVARGDLITGQGATAKWTKLAKGTAGQVLTMGENEPAWATLSLGNDDIASDADIAVSKLALATGSIIIGASSVGSALDAKGDGKIIVGNGSTAASVAVSGDVSLSNDGSTEVSDLTIASEAEGDILYFDGTNWTRLAAGDSGKYLKTQGVGSVPIWDTPNVGIANKLASSFTLEGGTYDPATTITSQTSAAAALTVPDLAGVAQEWVFSKVAQTLEGKTLTAPKIANGGYIADANGNEQVIFTTTSDAMNEITVANAATAGSPSITASGEDNVDLTISAKGTGNVVIGVGSIQLGVDGEGILDDNGNEQLLFSSAEDAINEFTITNAATGGSPALSVTGDNDNVDLTLTPKGTGNVVLGLGNLQMPATAKGILDDNGNEQLIFTTAADAITYVGITNGATTVMPRIQSDGEGNIGLLITGKGTGNVVIGDAVTTTKAVEFSLVGATEGKTATLTFVHTDDVAITFPDADCTLVGKDTTDTLTNKTIDCDGTGNTITNIEAGELKNVADAGMGVPFIVRKSVTNLAAAGTNVLGTTHPKLRVIDVWFVATSADSGTVQLKVGQVGSIGAAVTDEITIAAADKGISRAGELDDAAWEVAANTGLVAVGDGGASVDGEVFVMAVRVA